MTIFTTQVVRTCVITASILLFSAAAQSAAYIKFDGVDGESTAKHSVPAQSKIKTGTTAPQQGLLLPAVQSAREAGGPAKPSTEKKSRGDNSSAGDEHEIEYDLGTGV